MLTIHRISTADVAAYQFMENLMTQSFPPEEYRKLEELRRYTDEKERFHNNIVFDGTEMVGLITYWDFGRFCYVEHFAVHPTKRNGGYGSKVMDSLRQQLAKPIVLEVEMPDNEMAKRRIGFYERNGFRLWDCEYLQPPYKQGDGYLPMRIMACGSLCKEEDFDDVRGHIYKEVYAQNPPSAQD